MPEQMRSPEHQAALEAAKAKIAARNRVQEGRFGGARLVRSIETSPQMGEANKMAVSRQTIEATFDSLRNQTLADQASKSDSEQQAA